jgi:signal transduction histidine kinase
MRARPPIPEHFNGANGDHSHTRDVLVRQIAVSGSPPSDLIATLAHEFRSPLAAMQVTLEMLKNVDGLPPGEAEQLVCRLQRSVNWLAGLVGNLEIWSALEDGRLQVHWAPVSGRECAELAHALVQPILSRNRQEVRVVCPPVSPIIRGESRLLCQVLVNLLMNASQYGRRPGTIDVIIERVSELVEIRVVDDGPGIPEHERVQIFNRYARGSRSDRRTEGLGLGLHIVKTVVELHGGTVGVDSTPGRGASFWLRLPAISGPQDCSTSGVLSYREGE